METSDIPCNRAVHPPIRSRGLDSVYTTGEKAACLHAHHGATPAFDNMKGQSNKQGHTRTDRAATYGRSSDQKESPVDSSGCHQTGYQWQCRFSTLNRKRGRPRLRFKDTIMRNLKLRSIKTYSWTSLSQQRDKWRATLK